MRIVQVMVIYFGIALVLMTLGTATASMISGNDSISPSISVNTPSIPPSAHLEPGDSFQVLVNVNSGENELRALKFFIDYDNTALQLNNATYEELLGSTSQVLSLSDRSSGTYSFVVSVIGSEAVYPRNGTLLTLDFQVKPEATDYVYDLDLHDVSFVNENAVTIQGLIINDGQVLVTRDSEFTMVKLVSDDGTFSPGDLFQAIIKVNSYKCSLNDISLQLTYNSSALMVTNITDKSLLGDNSMVASGSGDNGAGMIIYEVNTTEVASVPRSGDLLAINFEVKANTSDGIYNLNLENVTVKNENNSEILDSLIVNSTVSILNLSNTIPIDDVETDEGIPCEEEEEQDVTINGINLQSGWNLISFPENLDEPSIDDVLQDFSDNEIDMVFYDDVYSGMMLVPAEFEPLKGYWVHNNMSEFVVINETYLESKVPSGPASLSLYPGWNAIGHTVRVELSARYALCTINDSYTEIKGPWISSESEYTYVGYNNKEGVLGGNQVGIDVFNMSVYEGYYVFVENECVLA